MLYHFFYQYLSDHLSWLNVFKYQTFRAMVAFFISFLFVVLLEPVFISWLARRGVAGQPIREDGPKEHEIKRGTPTMGGMVVVAGVVIASLLCCDLRNFHVWIALGVMIAYGYLGFLDDWTKIKKQDSGGLTEKQKLFWQGAIAASASLILIYSGFSTELHMPFLKGVALTLSFVFVPFSMLVMVGTSNAVNLTDGLDGLAIGPVMTVAFTYAVFAYASGHSEIAHYLNLEYTAYLGEISIVLSALIAAGLGFLWYNTYPAQVFMGDTGSLAMGGLLGFIAILVKQELLLPIAGGIFVVEALSVIIQRYYYKWKKKRVFRMAPIHHHFELLGWAEPKIIVRFWIISIMLALVTLSSLKLR